MAKDKRNIEVRTADWWVRTWNEHCGWMKDEIPDKSYASFMRSALHALRDCIEEILDVNLLEIAFKFKPSDICPTCQRVVEYKKSKEEKNE